MGASEDTQLATVATIANAIAAGLTDEEVAALLAGVSGNAETLCALYNTMAANADAVNGIDVTIITSVTTVLGGADAAAAACPVEEETPEEEAPEETEDAEEAATSETDDSPAVTFAYAGAFVVATIAALL